MRRLPRGRGGGDRVPLGHGVPRRLGRGGRAAERERRDGRGKRPAEPHDYLLGEVAKTLSTVRDRGCRPVEDGRKSVASTPKGTEMEFRILGPLEVSDNGRPVAIVGPKQRALLASLLLHANEVVSADRLIDELWGESPPPTAGKTLQAHI